MIATYCKFGTLLVSFKWSTQIHHFMRLVIPTLIICLIQSVLYPLFAQDRQDYRVFTSQLYNQQLRLADTTARFAFRGIEASTRRIDQGVLKEEVIIHVVFHVLYALERDRVSETQILAQLESLNKDFAAADLPGDDVRDPNGVFRKLATDTGIRFCMAATDPNGVSVSAINFRRIASTGDITSIKQSVSGISPWDTDRYLNVWISPLPELNSGFAQLPGAEKTTDGIVIDPRYFGTGGTALAPFNGGKTLTHLIGTYLGLNELWSNDGCGDDGVDDTPVHNAPNFGIPGSGHYSTCDGYPLEMTMNFMDNTDDAAQYMFTYGQALRMRSVLASGQLRAKLTDAPIQCKENTVIPNKSPANVIALETSLKNNQEEAFMELTPNPAKIMTRLTLSLPHDSKGVIISVFDAKGRLHSSWNLDDRSAGSSVTSLDLPTENWVPGAYLVKASFSSGTRQLVKRLIVVQ